MSSRKPPAVAAALALLVILAVLFAPALFQGRILAPLDITTTLLAPWNEDAAGAKPRNHCTADAVTQYLPYRLFAEKSLREDGYIGWNPYEMGGYNLAANTMAVPASWTMQLHRFLPFKDAWNLGLLAEFLTAGIGMLVFLRSRGLGWAPCLLGAVSYMANSQFVFWIHHRWALGSFCWMPWVLWAARDLNWKRPSPHHLLLPVFLSLAILGGTLQHMAFVVMACGCVFVGQSIDFKNPLASWKPATAWMIAGILAFSFAAFSVYPQISAYFTNIEIGHTRGGIGYPNGFSQPIFNAFLIPLQIWPWLVGDHSTIDGFRLIKCGYMDIAYIGTIPMVLALAGLFRKSMPSAAKWLIVAGLLIPLTPLVGPLYHRVQLLFLLGASWMAAEMLATLHGKPSFIIGKILPAAVVTIILGLTVGALLPSSVRAPLESSVVSHAVATAKSSFSGDAEWIASRALEWTRRFSIIHPHTAWISFLLVLGTAGTCIIMRNRPASARWGALAILSATTLELSTLFHHWCTFSPPDQLQPPTPAIETIRGLAGSHRVSQQGSSSGITTTFAFPNLLASRMIPSVDAYESIQYRSSMQALADQPAHIKLSLAGVGLTIRKTDEPADAGTESWPAIPVGRNHVIRRNPEPAPVIAAGLETMPTDPAEIHAVLKSAASINTESATMNHIRFRIPTAAKWLRISQNWHEGWKWRAQGGSWRSFDTNSDASCWIKNPPPAGTMIEARFFPRPYSAIALSSIAGAIWFGCFLVLKRPSIMEKCQRSKKLPPRHQCCF